MGQPHNYKCDTCNFYRFNVDPGKWYCDKAETEIHISAYRLIRKTGCASYTPNIKKVVDVLKELEWSGCHTDYEDSWAVMTIACPSCFNDKKDGHKKNCRLAAILHDGEINGI
jgi:hypothetical protein